MPTSASGTGRSWSKRRPSIPVASVVRGVARSTRRCPQRVFRCEECGLVLDRDETAARNLAALVAAVTGNGPETRNARGRDGSPAVWQAVPEETGSRHRRIAG
ncbi:zinc ribbon domain-containing protein [Thermaerobacter composti]|uniref:Zinc ribbon domain-containing protein n=1 Tax=Thermaerobacter composti TaxID=554949 RepID=A0ABZ0QLG3_9FIRM|nr:zinc ribbon domain-containing protein [Thermaerobacter composti]WPD18344.1 zinc ribbon domain-containing protein [Thermaerobacter composti]